VLNILQGIVVLFLGGEGTEGMVEEVGNVLSENTFQAWLVSFFVACIIFPDLF